MKLNVLVLHDVADFAQAMPSISDYPLCFERYAPRHNYLYHRVTDPVTNALRDIRFHVVIIESCALSYRRVRPRERWQAVTERLAFLGESDAVKVGFPQDDYHESELLDALFDEWKFDFVYTVLPDHHALVYPRSIRRAHLETVLTGYVDDNAIGAWDRFKKPFSARTIDVGQRVTFYSPLGGRHARLKGDLAERMKDAARAAGFTVDISTRVEDRIFGEAWPRFLGDCRFVTGSESGVSVFDPKGEVSDSCDAYLAQHPGASFEEVERACFPGLDGQYVFSAVSPRLFEVTMMRCCQVMIEAPYLGVLKPHEHYIPVRPDLSNLNDAVGEMRDFEAAQRRASACYATLVESPDWRYSSLVARVFDCAARVLSARHVTGTDDAKFGRLKQAHPRELADALRQTPREAQRQLGWFERIAASIPDDIRARAPRRVVVGARWLRGNLRNPVARVAHRVRALLPSGVKRLVRVLLRRSLPERS